MADDDSTDVEKIFGISLTPKQREKSSDHIGILGDGEALAALKTQLEASDLHVDTLLGNGLEAATFSLKNISHAVLKIYKKCASPIENVLQHPTAAQLVGSRTFELNGEEYVAAIFPKAARVSDVDDSVMAYEEEIKNYPRLAGLLQMSQQLIHWKDVNQAGQIGVLLDARGEKAHYSDGKLMTVIIDSGSTDVTKQSDPPEYDGFIKRHHTLAPEEVSREHMKELRDAQVNQRKLVMDEINCATISDKFNWSEWNAGCYNKVFDATSPLSQWIANSSATKQK